MASSVTKPVSPAAVELEQRNPDWFEDEKLRAMFAALPAMWKRFSKGDDFPGAVDSLIKLAVFSVAAKEAMASDRAAKERSRVVYLQGKLSPEDWEKQRGDRYLKPASADQDSDA